MVRCMRYVREIRVFEDQVGIPSVFFSISPTSDDGFNVWKGPQRSFPIHTLINRKLKSKKLEEIPT